ncbi:MAG: hypothetical protein ACK4KT_05580 [Thermaurantimonas sp.]
MPKLGYACIYVLTVFIPFGFVSAQNFNPRFYKKVIQIKGGDSIAFSPRTYLPSVSFRSEDGEVDSCFVKTENHFVFLNNCDEMQVEVTYYLLPEDYLPPYELMDRSILLPTNKVNEKSQPLAIGISGQTSIFDKDFSGISRTGAISRAVRVGTNQSAVLNSSLDLQMSGYLPDSTLIRASITDNRIPVQPDGYSQQLRDIDRIFIEVSHKSRGSMIAGDYSITNTDHYFLNFDRRITGLGLATSRKYGKNMSGVSGQINGALSRGIFARNSFMGQEGNQGPYKLFGNNNELFIIIVSGSERVYLDGILLTRGQEYDYVMDYNAGEITFTALRPITRERRIVIEFQYTTLLYLRSIAYAQAAWNTDKFSAELVHYLESDSRNQTLFQDLTEGEKQLIGEAGSDFSKLKIPSATEVPFSPDEPLYEKIIQPGFGEIFVLSRDSTRQLYRVQFTFVGSGNGNYIQSNTVVNGRVFEWIPPLNGRPQGSYEPVKQLTPPQSISISSLRTSYDAGPLGALELQTAYSQKNLNRYAMADHLQDGYAIRANHALNRKFGRLNLKSGAYLDWLQADFTTVERVRQVEFKRDWALADSIPAVDQWLSGVQIELSSDTSLQALFELSTLRQGVESRRKYSGNLSSSTNYISIKTRFSWLTIQNPSRQGSFIRQDGDVALRITSSLSAGVRTDFERNIQTIDYLPVDGSYHFLHTEPYIRLTGGSRKAVEVFGVIRSDDTVYNRILTNAALSRGGGIKSDWHYRSNLDFNTMFLYRQIRFDELTGQSNFAAYTGRIRLQQRWLRNSLMLNSLLETGTGTEPMRVFSYLEVPAGTGTHTWIDYNGNGIKELDEFEPARFPAEAAYIRIFAPSSQFIRVEFSKISQSLLFNPVSFASKLTGWKKFLTRFSVQSTVQTDSRRQLTDPVNKILHLPTGVDDTLTLGALIQHRHTLFFDRTRSKFGWDVNYLFNTNANLLAFGTEEARRREYPVNIRWKIIRPLLIRFTINYVEKENLSENFPARNFSINENIISPRIEFQPNERYRTSFTYEYSDKKSSSGVAAGVASNRLTSEHYLASASKYAVNTSLQWISNRFSGEANSPLGFAMLEGLQPGNNLVVSTQIQRNLTNGLQVSITYEGRWSAQMPYIQSGVMQLKAFF